ncbi:ABC transporter substrate-binding protein [Benzoatithermus flavus]|uniref:ABC transporter substrate-binding protein n=1 Tax=Benzoatithermus flavus TaxID=3108223 RepID=A0ABU8XQF5_9PROT
MARLTRRLALAAAATLVALAGFAEAKEWKKVRIGVEGAYPPFSSVSPEGKLQGFDIDIAYALCEAMKVECTLVQQDWDGIIPALLAKKYDAIIASMSITEERKKTVDFTNKYYHTPARFVARKDSGIQISKEGLKGKKVGVQRATIHDKYITDNFGDDVEVVRYGTADEANLDLVNGRIDLRLDDSVALSEGLLKTDKGKDFEFVGSPLNDPKWFGEGAGIAIRKGDTDLKEMFNKAIDQIRADGTYEKIERKYFDFDVYGS